MPNTTSTKPMKGATTSAKHTVARTTKAERPATKKSNPVAGSAVPKSIEAVRRKRVATPRPQSKPSRRANHASTPRLTRAARPAPTRRSYLDGTILEPDQEQLHGSDWIFALGIILLFILIGFLLGRVW